MIRAVFIATAAFLAFGITATSADACARFSIDGRNWITFTNVCSKQIMITMHDGGGCSGGCAFGPLKPGGQISWGAVRGRVSVRHQFW